MSDQLATDTDVRELPGKPQPSECRELLPVPASSEPGSFSEDEPERVQGSSRERPATKGDEIRARIEANRKKRLAIAEAMKAEAGVSEHQVWHERNGGRAYLNTGEIVSPEGRNMAQLYILAHECGHVFLHCSDYGKSLPTHVREFEAESYANQAFNHHGMTVPLGLFADGCLYVGKWIKHDEELGIPIDPRARDYANFKRSPHLRLRRIPQSWSAEGAKAVPDPEEVKWQAAFEAAEARRQRRERIRDEWRGALAELLDLAESAWVNTYMGAILGWIAILIGVMVGWIPFDYLFAAGRSSDMTHYMTALAIGTTWASLRLLWRTAIRVPANAPACCTILCARLSSALSPLAPAHGASAKAGAVSAGE